MREPGLDTAPGAERGLPLGRLALGAALLLGLFLLGRLAGDRVEAFAAWIDGLGALGPLIFALGYAIAVVAFVPASLLTLAAGALFGLAQGTALVFVAASAGACLAFLVARHLARGWIERRLAGNVKFAAVDREIATQGRKIVFLLRLSPVFPFSLLNYALGLTQVRFPDYAIACIGMLPGTFLYVYLGALAGNLAVAAGGEGRETTGGEWALLGIGLLATVAVVTLVTRIARRALADATARSGPPPQEVR